MASDQASTTPTCCDCGRAMLKAKKVHEGQRYCATCYPRLFKRRMCAGCGNFARLPIFDLSARCGGCARNRPCVRCQKVEFKIGLMTQYGPACKACARYFRVPAPCEVCGKLSRQLAQNQITGLRSCPKCSGPDAATCPSCRRHRVLVESAQGEKLCKPCSYEGTRPCGTCGTDMPAGRGHECEHCYWRRTLRSRLAIDQQGFASPEVGALFVSFGEWLEREMDVKKAAARVHTYFGFFSQIDHLWGRIPSYEALLEHFHAGGLRRAEVPMRWLVEAHGVRATADAREAHSEQRRLDELLSQVTGQWESDVLTKYHRALIAKLNQHDVQLRSVRLAIRSAVNFLNQVQLTGGALPTQRTLESFWRHWPGQVAAVTGFINFLNKTLNLKLDPRPNEKWLKAAKRHKSERELIDLFKNRYEVRDFEAKWIVKGLAYFHGIRRANRTSLDFRPASFREVAGFEVDFAGSTLWLPSAESYGSTHVDAETLGAATLLIAGSGDRAR